MHMFAMLALFLGAGPAHAEVEDDLKFDLEGYYRTRGYMFKNLFAVPLTGPGAGRPDQDARYMQQRLRLQPTVSYEELASFTMQVDVLDDVIWGDNANMASTALFAGPPSNTGITGTETEAFQLKRAWMQFTIPVGVLRVGRQPSHWGSGILANHGDGFDDMFGENHYGSTYDRVLFATRPIALGQKIAGKADSGVPLFFVLGVDRLVEEPLDQYYGFRCTERPEGGGWIKGQDDQYDERCDLLDIKNNPGRDGLTDQEHGYTEERDPATRGEDWWADQSDDVVEFIYALLYKGEDINMMGSKGDLTVGMYTVNRRQLETESNVWIVDAYMKFLYRGLLAEAEVVRITGKTNAIALPGAVDESSPNANPLYKNADIWGYMARLGYQQQDFSAIFETGYASGDDDVTDDNFSGRPLNPDHNVGLLLYEEILSRVTAHNWTEDARGLWSKGGVYNSRYIYPSFTFRPMNGWEINTAYLLAWPDRPDGVNILCTNSDTYKGEKLECAKYDATDHHLGWEIDVGVKHQFHKHILFAVEGAYARTSDRIPLDRTGLNPEGKFYTLQSRIAFEF
jgi:hypothetical protein